MSTLTDRYVWAVVRSLPEAQRDDIDRELRASIDDSIESLVENGHAPDAAERDTLTELGDPDKLAAGYGDRPTFLIGPTYYFDYMRLLKVLFAVVLPIVVVVIAVIQGVATQDVGKTIGGTIPFAIGLIVHLGFWPTLVFAIIERSSPARRADFPRWSLDNLPELPTRSQVGIADAVAPIVMLAFFVGAVVWQQFSSVVSDASGPIPALDPDLWAFWLPYFFVVIALEAAFYLALYVARRWTLPFALINIPLGLAFAIPAVWLLAEDHVVNPAFVDAVGWDSSLVPVLAAITIAVIILGTLWDWIDGFIKFVRGTR